VQEEGETRGSMAGVVGMGNRASSGKGFAWSTGERDTLRSREILQVECILGKAVTRLSSRFFLHSF